MAKSADPLYVMVCEITESDCALVEPIAIILDMAKIFPEKTTERVPVVSNGKLVGIASITDIIMESNVETVELLTGWVDSVERALRHKRLCWGADSQIEAERATAHHVLAKLRS